MCSRFWGAQPPLIQTNRIHNKGRQGRVLSKQIRQQKCRQENLKFPFYFCQSDAVVCRWLGLWGAALNWIGTEKHLNDGDIGAQTTSSSQSSKDLWKEVFNTRQIENEETPSGSPAPREWRGFKPVLGAQEVQIMQGCQVLSRAELYWRSAAAVCMHLSLSLGHVCECIRMWACWSRRRAMWVSSLTFYLTYWEQTLQWTSEILLPCLCLSSSWVTRVTGI